MTHSEFVRSLDEFSALASLFIQFGRHPSELFDGQVMMFDIKPNGTVADGAVNGGPIYEPTEDYLRALATLRAFARDRNQELIEHAENHRSLHGTHHAR